jgi:hypothetical protein
MGIPCFSGLNPIETFMKIHENPMTSPFLQVKNLLNASSSGHAAHSQCLELYSDHPAGPGAGR